MLQRKSISHESIKFIRENYTMNNEVRYQMLRPSQIVVKRKECPVVYIPIGTLEWHGVHNPLGADALQAEALAIMCAQKGGGLAFPPLYYGENRLNSIQEASARDKDKIAEAMELPAENFHAEKFPFNADEQSRNYNNLLMHILSEAESLGFKLAVIIAGHYPLVDHATAAALLYNQRSMNTGRKMLSWAFADYLLLAEEYPKAGDHGGNWETSHLRYTHPETVDMNALPSDENDNIVGLGYSTPPQQATPEFGKEIFEAAAELAVKEVQNRLAHPENYLAHGCSMKQQQ